MKILLALIAAALPGMAFASQVQMGKCLDTNHLTKIVTVCEATADGQPAYAILDMSGTTIIYGASEPKLIGTDDVFGTTKYSAALTLLGKIGHASQLVPDPGASPSAKIYLGYKAGTKNLAYLQGSSEIDFLIDLRQ